ncbi:MAG: alpha-hydroxy-acid oxidizing protein [Saprospiraceae bacterium]|nr:alpha-hydroxy-acid oxidizing protein [Saprospiraceae bacterium]MCB0574845.1 alpha-hydroxy-acid oxidizing protein [Saprospiraceae bacterium]MCB9355698.1 alpha-hydroxy-acid oxidizing protein [Lewinellaceae bacterium]
MKRSNALDRQRAIYARGAAGLLQSVPFDPAVLERKAAERMTPEALAYIAGGAGLERSMASNTGDFDRWRIVPRMLRDVDERDTAVDLFGHRIPAPFFLAPIGVLEMAHRDADLAIAAAAAQAGIPYIFSNQASVPMERCAAAMETAPRFFQLYWSRSDELVASFLQRAEACGCSAVVLTLDTTMLGWRTRDLDFASLPFLQGKGIAQYTSDPVFLRLLDTWETQPTPKSPVTLSAIRTLIAANRRFPGPFFKNLFSGKGLQAVRVFTQLYSRPNITWKDLPFLRKHTNLPVILKGILHPDDAKKALDYGIDGIYVSNHGGRQVDGSISAIAALPGIVDAVRGKVPVLFDSGVRGGADAFKALALGATAVGIGRPYCYALAIRGRAGVSELLDNWIADLELTMGLAGCMSIDEIRQPGTIQTGRF